MSTPDDTADPPPKLIPPPPAYPPPGTPAPAPGRAAGEMDWHRVADQFADRMAEALHANTPMPEAEPGLSWAWVRPAYNGSALAAGVLISPFFRKALAIAGDEYAIAVVLMAAALLIDLRRRWWLTRAVLFATVVATFLSPAARVLLTILTGA